MNKNIKDNQLESSKRRCEEEADEVFGSVSPAVRDPESRVPAPLVCE